MKTNIMPFDAIQKYRTKSCVQLVPLSVGTSLYILVKKEEKQEEIDTHHEHTV